MRLLGKTVIAGMLGLCFSALAIANTDAQISRYEQAKLRLSYEGSAGNLLQQIAQRLKVGFIAYDVDISRKVSIQNDTETSIRTISEQLEKQLTDADIRFETIGERLFMVISTKDGKPLLPNTEPKAEQFVGDIVFEGEPSASPSATAQENTTESTTPSALQNIFNIATNKDRLAAVQNKKAPQYKTITKENLGLKNIRVTPLGTFLIFDSQIEAAKFKVKGTFEEMAQGENIVAILHQNSEAPSRIEIENESGKKLVLEAHKPTQPNKKAKK